MPSWILLFTGVKSKITTRVERMAMIVACGSSSPTIRTFTSPSVSSEMPTMAAEASR